jgi:hypothetical protein
MLPGHLEQRLYCLFRDLMSERDNKQSPINDIARYAEGFALIQTFDDADLLTADRGLVITTEDCHEFRLTITQRR